MAWTGTILAILNLYVTVMPPINFRLSPTILTILYLPVASMPPTKFQYNTTFGSGGDVENVKN